MIIAIIFWNLISLVDCYYYQSVRYQKDRYKDTIDLYIKDIFLMIIFSTILIYFEAKKIYFIYELFLILLLPFLFYKVKKEINKFVITKRIIRLFILNFFVDIFLLLSSFLMNHLFLQIIMTFFIVFHHFVFYFFVYLTHPIEMKIRENYVKKAKQKIDQFKGIRIGITGSYGKTSIKNLVYDVLSMKYLCLKTRASFNNQMGVTKTILEEMKNQEVFICEMGADHVHEIEDLCEFVNPEIGILSAVGPQHLSTFKTIENILHEKMKILEKLPKNGMGFYNFDNFYLRQFDMKLNCDVIRVGIHSEAQIKATNISCDHLGSQFDVELDGNFIHFKTSLLGEHNILNCLFAIAIGHYLEVDPTLIQMAILCTIPTPHRMELKPFGRGMCIDNAYNSNPESAKASLEVLKKMPGKHYIITPGFIDLGELHDYYSEHFGRQMSFCEKVILVGECNQIQIGLRDSHYNMENVILVSTMKEALVVMHRIIEEKDTVLIENDIPEALMNTS